MGFIEGLIPLAAVTLPFLIPIIIIVSKHQRQMAELYHSSATNPQNQMLVQELNALRQEVQLLRERSNEQYLMLENMKGMRGLEVGQPPITEQQTQQY